MFDTPEQRRSTGNRETRTTAPVANIHEYFPKGYDFNTVLEENLQAIVDQLKRRPRKYLGYKTPPEVYFSSPLHLV